MFVRAFRMTPILKHIGCQQINPVIRPESACVTLHISELLHTEISQLACHLRTPPGKHLLAHF